MIENNNFCRQTVNTLNELKFEFHKKPDELKIPIYNENKIIAFLRPISKVLGNDEEKYIKLLSEWRATNWQAYPTVFKVTEEGTSKWIKDQLINREDRILFIILTPDNEPIGHLGLSNFDFNKREAEIDNVIRGVSGILPGIITLALNTLVQWTFNKLKLNRLFLRVFLDNERAIRLYERCGFKGIKKIPLHKVIEGENIKYEEIPEGKNLPVDRVFYLMELLNKK